VNRVAGLYDQTGNKKAAEAALKFWFFLLLEDEFNAKNSKFVAKSNRQTLVVSRNISCLIRALDRLNKGEGTYPEQRYSEAVSHCSGKKKGRLFAGLIEYLRVWQSLDVNDTFFLKRQRAGQTRAGG
jgi:hypothetical protein